MLAEQDILYLGKDHVENLDSSCPLKALVKTTLTSCSNKEILKQIMEHSLIKDLSKCVKENMEECKLDVDDNVDELMTPLKDIMTTYVSNLDSEKYLLLANLLFNLFLKENMLGPSFRNRTGSKANNAYTEDELEFLHILSPLGDDIRLQDFLLKYFGREGEDVYINTKGLTFFLYLDLLLKVEVTTFVVPNSIKVWKARYHMAHNQLLTSNV